MNYKVEWNQWYRCGYHGDDADYEAMTMDFETLSDAEGFVIDLINGKHRGTYDMSVHRDEVKIIKED